MLMKIKREDSTCLCGRETFRFLTRMTRGGQASPYKRMESDIREKKRKSKNLDEKKPEELSKGKENLETLANKEIKGKKSKKKGWKRVRQVALTTCRYIGMGAAHMSPATIASPQYCVDPKIWNEPYNKHYKSKVPQQTTPHWTSTLMYSTW